MVIREIDISARKESPPALPCFLNHQWQFKRGDNGNFNEQLREYIRHMVTNTHQIEGKVYEGYQVDETLPDKLSLDRFRHVGLLRPIIFKFKGDINAVVDYAFPKESPVNGNEEACVHHWNIDTPRGSTSKGSCQKCGAVGSFRNSGDFYKDEPTDSVGLETSHVGIKVA